MNFNEIATLGSIVILGVFSKMYSSGGLAKQTSPKDTNPNMFGLDRSHNGFTHFYMQIR